jgi:DNA-binding NtrC family response regulator
MQKRILVVDDDEVMRSLLKRQLHFPNCETDTAECGNKALQLIRNKKYDLIITDFHIPDIHEDELIKTIKKECPHIPILVMSGGLTDKEYLLTELGVYKFFSKPLNLKELKKIITDILFTKKN